MTVWKGQIVNHSKGSQLFLRNIIQRRRYETGRRRAWKQTHNMPSCSLRGNNARGNSSGKCWILNPSQNLCTRKLPSRWPCKNWTRWSGSIGLHGSMLRFGERWLVTKDLRWEWRRGPWTFGVACTPLYTEHLCNRWMHLGKYFHVQWS